MKLKNMFYICGIRFFRFFFVFSVYEMKKKNVIAACLFQGDVHRIIEYGN